MTRATIQQFLELLAQSADAGNDAAADDDRGRDNKALCIVVYDDGSGLFCTATQDYDWERKTVDPHSLHIGSVQQFNGVEDGAALIEGWL